MAYLTLTNVDLDTEQQLADLNAHLTIEMAAGNTDGIATKVTLNGVNTADQQPMNLNQRSWKDSASANAYISYLPSLVGTVNYGVVVNPL